MLCARYDVGVLAQGFGYTAVQEYSLSLSRRGCVRDSYSAECVYLQCCAPTLMQMIASGFGACGFGRWSRQGASALRIGGWQPTSHSQSDVQNCIDARLPLLHLAFEARQPSPGPKRAAR